MKTTINQIKTFYNNHPLKNELERLKMLYSLKWNFKVDESNINLFSDAELKNYYVNTKHSRYTFLDHKIRGLEHRISKDLHNRFKDIQMRITTPKIKVFGFKTWAFFSIRMTSDYELKFYNPLSGEYENSKQKINSIQDIEKALVKDVKSLFFGNGLGHYSDIQRIYGYTKGELIKKIKERRDIEASELYIEEEFDKYATLKSIKRNLGLIFNDYQSINFIRDAVNIIGVKNKGKRPQSVFCFDTSNIDTSQDIDTIENSFISEYNNQSKNAILI